MQTNVNLRSNLARFFALTLASILIAATASTPIESNASDIVVFKKTESAKYLSHFTGYEAISPFGGTTEVPGGRAKYSSKQRSYIVMNTTTGAYREVRYYIYKDYDVIREKYYKVRALDYDLADRTLKDQFETDAAARRNYLVISFKGSGNGDNFTADPSGDPFYSTTIETITGIVKLQKIKTDAGTVECPVPSRLTGTNGIEKRGEFSDGSEKERIYSTGKVSLTLDKKRTRDFLDAMGTTLDEGVAAVIAFLNSKGYYEAF